MNLKMAGASQKTPKFSKNGKIMQQRLGNCIINYLKQSRQIKKKNIGDKQCANSLKCNIWGIFQKHYEKLFQDLNWKSVYYSNEVSGSSIVSKHFEK